MVRLKPTEKQLQFLDWELGLFIHFGIRTFYEGYQDWDHLEMDASAFNPTHLNCEQWIEAAVKGGAKYAILTAKHHDGFANWPTKYSDYSVKATPWKKGSGDVVREFVEACAKFKVKVGLYYSPAEYTLVKSQWEATDYDNYFINQISELLTQYGVIELIWFDGCGSENHHYDWKRIIKVIRQLQPGIRIFNMGDPDIRWIGNELGLAPLDNWNEVDSVLFSIMTQQKAQLGSQKVWLPGECDCRMREANWFYSENDEHTVKSLPELLGLYYYSVGRGANLLLNIGPNRQGLLPDPDVLQLLKLGDEINKRFSQPLASLKNFHREGNLYKYSTSSAKLVNHVIIAENMVAGQSIRKFSLYSQGICLYEGKTVGHKVICSFPTLKINDLMMVIEESVGPYEIKELQLFYVKSQ